MSLTAQQKVLKAFSAHFGGGKRPAIYRAPGRVNLIGEHTDYNLGFVFPIATEMACYVAIAPSGNNNLRLWSEDFQDELSLDVSTLSEAKPTGNWSDYAVGVIHELAGAGIDVRGADVCISSEVPIGSGLSSSAALEIATACAMLGSQHMDRIDIALLGQRAESQFVGMPCGIMDQYASVFGKPGSAIKIDCRSLDHEYVPISSALRIVAVNSLVKHELGTSAYRQRVAECQAAVAALQAFDKSIQSLRDVSLEFFVNVQQEISPVPRRRAHHVISENDRVQKFAAAARAGDLAEMGKLFVASHRSMQFDYEISCAEIDFLVDTAISIPGVFGARMTGGGFGGCTVNLVDPEELEVFHEHVGKAYVRKYGKTPEFYVCTPAAGAGRVAD